MDERPPITREEIQLGLSKPKTTEERRFEEAVRLANWWSNGRVGEERRVFMQVWVGRMMLGRTTRDRRLARAVHRRIRIAVWSAVAIAALAVALLVIYGR